MANRIDGRRSAPPPEPRVGTGPTLEAAADRPRRIDAYIDYFASGDRRPTSIEADPCGETLLDGDVW